MAFICKAVGIKNLTILHLIREGRDRREGRDGREGKDGREGRGVRFWPEMNGDLYDGEEEPVAIPESPPPLTNTNNMIHPLCCINLLN